ncbi:hypothetical protein CAOG_06960 [Capsaspora owczarzaki ATCC 30864]|uniref:hypothetical protein n=1 Tax=Capsaspora owczarzaki (strain ATCC 30864) TaxID=595528 RepID=UPI0001FE3851|nr:hypothetical protein CAOG_06960 [Capsaspora owczarzaki ATCC 30864]|eukprot:XP_004343684.1 hypothetical protein CAOG_06960 [Capsaspora owczarzaki ATCC 30864]
MSGRSFDLNSAVGGSRVARPVSSSVAVRDLASQTVLKVPYDIPLPAGGDCQSGAAVRQAGQGNAEEMKNRDLKGELELREQEARDKKLLGSNANSTAAPAMPALGARPPMRRLVDASIDGRVMMTMRMMTRPMQSDEIVAMTKTTIMTATREIHDELERRQEEERIRNQAPSQSSNDFNVKRGWDDDVVFKNCAKDAPTHEKRFINDSLRSDFHRKFMDRYIK